MRGKRMNDLIIRNAEEQDTGRLLEIYAPYVTETAVSFEYESPSVEEFHARMDENNTFDGETCATYTWDGTGWVDAEFNPIDAGEKMIVTGDAFLVGNNMGEGLSFQVSGEVDLINKNLISAAQFSLCGNSTPVEFDLTDVQIINKDGTLADFFAVVLQTMDENNTFDGETCATYTWDGTGWVDSEFAPIEKGAVNVQPGNAFLVGNNMGTELYFKVPSPIK